MPQSESADNLPPLQERLARLLMLVAEEVRPCKACGVQLAFVQHKLGKLTPYTIEGVRHSIDCQAEDFRKRKVAGRG